MKYLTCFLILILMGCGAKKVAATSTGPTPTPADGTAEPAARFIFNKSNFTDLTDYVIAKHTVYSCLGDITQVHYANGADYSGSPTFFPAAGASDDFAPTTKPAFVKNVSVDMTQTYFPYSTANLLQTDNCSYRGISNSANPGPCADFDVTPPAAPTPTVAPTATPTTSPTATPTSTPYYDTGYYRVRDDWCANQGPVLSPNTETTKSYVGGVNIDLDRAMLGTNEDLLMNVTYQALNANSAWPSTQGVNDDSILEVKLIGTGLGLDLLIGQRQPRIWNDYSNSQIPVYLKTIATFQDPFSSLRTEQVYIPLSGNSLIDRIRIERVRGSYFLYQIDLYRLGNRAE